METWVNLNGTLLNSKQVNLALGNRAFRFGDSLFETIRIRNGKMLFFKDHWLRLQKGIKALQFELPFNFTAESLNKEIQLLLSSNKFEAGGRLRLTLFRNGSGGYIPSDNSFSYFIEADTLPDNVYNINQKGLTIDLYAGIKKQQDFLANIKSGNSMVYVLAGVHCKKNELDDCIIQNSKGTLIESTNASVFAVKNGVLYTPLVSDGCVDGIMRKVIMRVAALNRIAVYEIQLMQSVLLSADELFLTNTIKGIKWVVAYKNKRYFNTTSKFFTEKLNQYIEANPDLNQ